MIREIKPEDINLQFKIKTGTEDVVPEPLFPGQERVDKAFEIGLKTEKEGYNIYVAGPEGIGRTTYTLQKLKKAAENKEVPGDICYYNNFEEPQKPKFIILPPGEGRKLSKDIDEVIENLKEAVVKTFESKEYEDERLNLIKEMEEKKRKIIREMEEEARKYGLAIVLTPTGFTLLPIVQGKVSPEALQIPEIREEFQKRASSFEEAFRNYQRELRKIDEKLQETLISLKRKVSKHIVKEAFSKLEEKYSNTKEAIDFLKYLEENVADNIDIFIRWKALEGNIMLQRILEKSINMFRINVVVDNSTLSGAPVIYEEIPTFKSLFGHISYKAEMGILYADHMSIVAGSLFKARNGYLVLRVIDILREPFLWLALKRAIFHKKIHLTPHSWIPFPFFVGIDPEPIPFNITIVLIGTPILYHLLSIFDPEFNRLFKVKAEFNPVISLTEDLISAFPSIIRKIIEDEKIKHLTPEGLSELLKYAVQLSGHRKKFNAVFAYITDILREANTTSKGERIDKEDIRRTIREKEFRLNLLEEKINELIEEGTLIIDVDGEKIGQVNGLSVYNLGDYSFGKPTRITAVASIGEKGIVNIEREADLSGPIYNKGVLILSGYISGKYGKEVPLSLSCSVAFEQSYGEVEGDSASLAELLAILSAISEVKLRQDIAVTGSIDQHGNVQPVGGIKEKIEGFYKTCKLKGLTGRQGVIIPSRNLNNLILEDEVIESIGKGKFHIYTVDNVDDAIELLTGIKPEQFHEEVFKQLRKFHEKAIKKKL